jgi:ubiquinone biosynthesis protein
VTVGSDAALAGAFVKVPRSRVFRRVAVVTWHCLRASALVGASVAVTSSRRPERVGAGLADLLERLGPSFVKLGQILGTRADIFPAAILSPLSRLQANLSPLSLPEAEREIARAFGRNAREVFPSLDPVPLGSASIASVFGGTLPDGRRVAIKVRRPGIGEIVAADVQMIRGLACLAARTRWLRDVPLMQSVDALCRCLTEQIDLRNERTNLDLLRSALARHPRVGVPAPLDEYCTESILTLELADVVGANGAGADVREAIETALAALYEMIFIRGVVHCDLHRGNLFLFADGRVTILDAGFIAKVDPKIRQEFALFFYGVAMGEGRLCADVSLEVAEHIPDALAYEDFVHDMSELVASVARVPAGGFSVAGFVVSLFDVQRRHGVRSTADFTTMILALLVFEGIAKTLHPRLDFQRSARPFVARAVLEDTALSDIHQRHGERERV